MEERKGFGSNFGFLMAAIGSAVGLGNIWGFPYKMGKCGGFTFLIVYLALAIVCGFIIMVGELAIGRKTGASAIKAYKLVSKKFKWIGWLGVASAFLIMSFYCALGGYCIKYIVLNFGTLIGAGFGGNGLSGGDVFGAFLTNQPESIIYGLVFVVLTMIIVMGGVSGGIEKMCSVGMPALFVMLLVCIVRALTMDGAVEGLKFMFVPGYAVEAGFIESAPNIFNVISTAGGQMFFSLSIGMAAMITYGSYLDKKEILEKNAVVIVCCDTLIALMAGLCVIPASVAYGIQNGIAMSDLSLGGPKLLFVTMQNVFNGMGTVVGSVFGIIFFLLVLLAAISSSISLLEAVVAHFVDNARDKGKGDKRKVYSLVVSIFIAILCVVVCADGLGSNGMYVPGMVRDAATGAWTYTATFNDCWLDFFDAISEGVMMPLGGLLMCFMLGWELRDDLVKSECDAVPHHKFAIAGFYRVCIKVITPICMVLVLYGQLKDFFGGLFA